MTAYRRLLDVLDRLGQKIDETRPDHDAMVQCPHHDDHNPSLHIADVHGQALLYCHAGCDTDDILNRIGWGRADLFDNRRDTRYDYADSDGTITRSVVRTATKKFWQLGDTSQALLYRLPAIKAALARNEVVFLCEGEKDVHALEAQGCTATTAPAGAQNFKHVDFTPLSGADVVAIADHDEGGDKWVQQVATGLTPIVGRLRFARARVGKDATDHFMAGCSLAELVPLDVQPINGAAEETARPPRSLRLTSASSVKPQPVTWLWHQGGGRVPAGALSIFAGREGTGKSSCAAWLAGRITTGELPGAFYGRPRRVFYVSVEESWAQALVPKLIATGADLEQINLLDVVTDLDEETMLSLPSDNGQLESILSQHPGAVVVIDPLMSVMGPRVDTHRERDVRTALDPLARMADRTGASILGVAHFNKSSGTDAANLITGSGAFKNVARAVFGFASEDDDRVMSQVKNSLGPSDLSWAYRLEQDTIPTDTGPAETVRFVIDGVTDRHVSDMLRSGNREDDSEDRNAAQEFLMDYLVTEGGEATAGDVIKVARPAGFSESQIKNARRRCKAPRVVSRKQGLPGERGAWVWAIETDTPDPEPDPEPVEGATKVPKVPGNSLLAPSAPSVTPSGCRVCGWPLSETVLAEGFDVHAACEQPTPEVEQQA